MLGPSLASLGVLAQASPQLVDFTPIVLELYLLLVEFTRSLLGSPTNEPECWSGASHLSQDTKSIIRHEIELPTQIKPTRNHPLVLLDTPGMDFDNRSIKNTLIELRRWKCANLGKNNLGGIIFVNNPSDNRLQGKTFSVEHSGALKKLCGKDWTSRIFLVNNPHQTGNEDFESARMFWKPIADQLQVKKNSALLDTHSTFSSVDISEGVSLVASRHDAGEIRAEGIYLFDYSQSQTSAQRILRGLLFNDGHSHFADTIKIPASEVHK
ncbi:hypothetical protein NP233_g888 [Leucocoprinus birnbaumii]|uniref:G domain-containing protein n=1 Tax=Leucocoprinus birnbaumii TaxID=56174 RepID=A0AAD5W1E4_9AGAR|nr:hypothetical protein NP233_g888 [Leucocoprinus birnbaumii]